MATCYGPATVTGVIVATGLLTYGIRASFVVRAGRFDGLSARVERALEFVPAAVLAALVAPSVILFTPAGVAVDKLVAGAVAVAVAWRTDDILATLGAGMAVVWRLGVVL